MRLTPKHYIYGISVSSLLTASKAQRQFLGSGQPSAAEWQSLNASLGGHLQDLRPWDAASYSSDPLFDRATCQQVISAYGNDTIRAQQPSALMWPNFEACGNGHGCGLNLSDPKIVDDATCEQGSIPYYSVAITNAQEASTIVKWAVANDVTLIVKSTGHDLVGRGAAPGTLQVNVAQLNNLEYIPQFVPQGSQDPPVSAVTVGGGTHMRDIAQLARRENVTVVVASCDTVGAGGYYQAGGHSTLAPTVGLGIDSVLQYEIVTADGTIRTINVAQDPDLFWAVRGGGSGNWGIIISVTIQAYPSMQVGGSIMYIQPNPAQNMSELGIQMMALYGKYQNTWIDAGISTMLSLNSTYQTVFLWPSTNDSLPLLFPFFDDLRFLAANYTIVSNETAVPMYDSWSVEELSFGPFTDAAGFPGYSTEMSSRLIPRSFLASSESIRKVAEAIWAGYETMVTVIESSENPGNLVAPPILSGNLPGASHLHRINETGANPALYEGSFLITLASSWDTFYSDQTYSDYISSIARSSDPLAELGIVGSYQGESNPYEVNWRKAFFGYKYSNLTNIKRKYDPTNFFNTWKGVDFVESRPSYRCYRGNAPAST